MGGETVAPPLRRDIEEAVQQFCGDIEVKEIRTLHLGPRTILVTLSVTLDPQSQAGAMIADLKGLREKLRSVDERIRYVLTDIS
jgi:hypothetical protein